MKKLYTILLVSILLFSCFIHPAFATTIFSDGFESGDFSAWTSTSGTPTIVTSPVHHGTYAAQFNASAEYITKTITAVNLIYVRVYFQSANYPSSNTDDRFTIFRVGTTGATYPHFIQWCRDSSGNVCWRVSPIGGATHYIYNPAPTLNTWYCIEIMCKIGTTNGEARTYINGVEVDTQTGLNNGGGGSINKVQVGLTTVVGTVPTTTEDCVVVADTYIGPEVSKAWYNIETWNVNLLTMMWRSVEIWNIQLLTMNWHNIESWLISLHAPKWYNVESWFINLLTMKWNDVENWLFNLWTMVWRNVEEWSFQFTIFISHTVEEWFVKFWILEAIYIPTVKWGMVFALAVVFAVVLALMFEEGKKK